MRQLILISALLLTLNTYAWDALPEKAPEPANNPTTPEKVRLGKALYFDPRLSSDGTISCNSCHNVMAGGDDNRAFSAGVKGQLGGRSAPTVWNAAFNSTQFWDGRAASLEEQAKGPITNPVEMGMPDHDLAIKRLQSVDGYQPLFDAAFGADSDITIDRVAQAIASYERTLITPNSPYDLFVKGDETAISEEAQAGMELFANVGCSSCHSGAAFNGPALPEGQGFFMPFPTFKNNDYVTKYNFLDDKGLAEVTHKDQDNHKFRVVTLRNVTLTAPYFHNGSVASLDEAIKVMAKTQLNKELSDQQVKQIKAFLETLTGPFPEQSLPRLPGTMGKSLVSAK